MRELSHRNFTVIGKAWERYVDFPGNVKYYNTIEYDKYPEIYNTCDIFLSCAVMEGGGPAGLIEAMHSNLFPVVSDTGNAREYIIHRYNGLIFPIDSDYRTICDLIEMAYTLTPQETLPYNDVWQTVRDYTWENYALQMSSIIKGDSFDPSNSSS
jgi:glycosyltransferase involved in cell wall biosynthesis